jgi:hypothetical protein
MNFVAIILIIFLVLFIPIPLHLRLKYVDNTLHFFLYGKEIPIKRKYHKKVKTNTTSTDYIGKLKCYTTFIKCTLNQLKHCHLKPKLHLNYSLNFGFEDAQETAIIFGMLNEFTPVIYSSLKNLFIIKDFHYSLTPDFNNTTIDLNVVSILNISIANTIDIVVIILFHLIKDIKIKNSKFHLTRRNNYGKSSN